MSSVGRKRPVDVELREWLLSARADAKIEMFSKISLQVPLFSQKRSVD